MNLSTLLTHLATHNIASVDRPLYCEQHFSLREISAMRADIAIQECHEALREPQSPFLQFASPHPYRQAGATYTDHSPFSLRESVAVALECAAESIFKATGFHLHLFDGYRPIRVQAYMRRYSFEQYAKEEQWCLDTLSAEQTRQLWHKVDLIWAPAEANPLCPPPHSTGAAVDLTLCHPDGELIDMGSAFDEATARSLPHYYAASQLADQQHFQHLRETLRHHMEGAGFMRLTHEWWHFSLEDQFWALRKTIESGKIFAARYGGITDG